MTMDAEAATLAEAPPDESGSAKLRRGVVIALGMIGGLVLLWLVGQFVPGEAGSIARAMMREAISPQTAAVAIAVIGLNVHFGFTGLLNIGQAGFMLLGAYGFAISVRYDVPLVPAVLIGLMAAVVFALILGLPTLKLRGDYLAIVTISAAEIIRYVGRSALLTDFTGAAQGIQGKTYRDPFTDLSFFGSGDASIGFLSYQMTGVNGWWVRFVAWTLVGLCVLAIYLLVRSPWGRLLRGIREDEMAILSLGKNAFAVKMQALVIGGVLGALGGIIYVLPSSVQPDSMGRALTFFAWTALLLGGAATIFGPVLGSILFFVVRIFIKGTADVLVPNSLMNSQQTEQFSWIVVGVALMLLVIFRPQGILGDKRELRFNV
ncbi:branched-chain amino acid ABC transporter permease [Nocardioides campestrisoli]|uniref:branched-chain amino acid ABC transporter permease n=1 Tax=Nocardioides campestrisoli TaxID=2736757 RepID=UPI001C631CBC|nr:branched-chain amino acid ABC transporter permease [Nocardioides campestrisoli]